MTENAAFSAELAPEVQAVNARLAAEGFVPFDATLMDPAEARPRVERDNIRWNVDLPPLAARREVRTAADASLGSAETRCVVVVPEGPVHGTILFVHGGGFAFNSPETHLRSTIVLAAAAGMAAVLPDYRLAPENPYPAGLKDTVAALRHLLARPQDFGLPEGPVVISGDSAGANLALAALLHEQDAGRPALAGGVLFYGVYGADFSTPSYRFFHDGFGLTTPKMQRYWDWYVADPAARKNPLVAPILASDAALAALPPLHLAAAGVDPLLSDTLGLKARLDALGRSDPLEVVPGVTHGFLQQTLALPQARKTLAEAGQAARRMAGKD